MIVGDFMHIVFFSTSDVFEAEEKLIQANIACKIVPTPVTDKAYCGVCVKTVNEHAFEILRNMEFNVV